MINDNIHDVAIHRIQSASKIVLYGASLAALGVLNKYKLPVAYLVDDTPGAAGRKLPNGLTVYSSERLKADKGQVFVVISAWTKNAILKISERLKSFGFAPDEDFVDCSILHFDSIRETLSKQFGLQGDLESFLACREKCLSDEQGSLSAIAGTWLFIELMRHLQDHVPGNVAECGVYQGGNAFLSLKMSPELRTRRYQLFDSFEGFSTLTAADPASRAKEFTDANLSAIKAKFAESKNVEIHKGYFNQTFPHLPEAQYALVYVDCDLYEATHDCLRYFHQRLAPGGMFFFHDFWLPEKELSDALNINLYRGVNMACREFFSSEEFACIIEFPETTHGLWVKPIFPG